MGPGYVYDAPNSIYQLPFNARADFEPNFNTIIFEDGAKHNDLMGSAPIRHCGWLISNRFLDLLQEFELPPHDVYPLPVKQNGQPVDGYVWLHLPQTIHCLEDNMTIPEVESTLTSEPIVSQVDILPLYSPVRFGYFFISNRLRKAIERHELSGIRFGSSKLFRNT